MHIYHNSRETKNIPTCSPKERREKKRISASLRWRPPMNEEVRCRRATDRHFWNDIYWLEKIGGGWVYALRKYLFKRRLLMALKYESSKEDDWTWNEDYNAVRVTRTPQERQIPLCMCIQFIQLYIYISSLCISFSAIIFTKVSAFVIVAVSVTNRRLIILKRVL